MVYQLSTTIAYPKKWGFSQNKQTNSRAEVLRTTQAFEKKYSPRTGKAAKWFKKKYGTELNFNKSRA